MFQINTSSKLKYKWTFNHVSTIWFHSFTISLIKGPRVVETWGASKVPPTGKSLTWECFPVVWFKSVLHYIPNFFPIYFRFLFYSRKYSLHNNYNHITSTALYIGLRLSHWFSDQETLPCPNNINRSPFFCLHFSSLVYDFCFVCFSLVLYFWCLCTMFLQPATN